MFKVDLHTHSTASPDGGIRPDQYRTILSSGKLDYIAITDHNRIDTARALQQELGDRIIVGEEIMTAEGEIIGLYLNSEIPSALPATETIRQIKDQGGLVYIPHPFETVRKGLHPAVLDEIVSSIDIIEVCNGRAFMQNRSSQAVLWAKLNHVAGAASSDAHGEKGLGRTYTSLRETPRRDSLVTLLKSGVPITDKPSLRSLLYPKYHRLRKKYGKAGT